MTRLFFGTFAALALAACGGPAANENPATGAVDEVAIATAVDRAVDQKALEQALVGTAEGAVRGAVDEAIQDVVPVPTQEMRAIGAAVDEKALVQGIGEAVNGKLLGDAVTGAVKERAPAP